MRKLKHNKKGFAQEVMFFAIVIFIISIIVIVALNLLTAYNEKYKGHDASTASKGIVQDSVDRYPNVFNWIFFTIIIIFMLVIFVSLYFLDTHPAFFFVGVILFAFALIAFAIIGNTYDAFANTPAMASETAELSILNFLMDNWFKIMLVIGFVGITLLFAKVRA